MTESQPLEKERASRYLILQTVGIAFGLAVVGVVIIAAVVLAVESPSARTPSVRAAPIATASTPDATTDTASALTGAGTPFVSPLPTATPVAVSTQISFPISSLTDNQTDDTKVRAPALTPPSIDAATLTATPVPMLAAPIQPAAVRPIIQSAPLGSKSTPIPNLPLDMFFYVKAYCHRSDDNLQVVDLFLTGRGGVPPYDYYDDTTFIGHDAGMVRFTMKASSGNPVPYKIIIVDSKGQRYMNEFFYKTGVSCKASK